MAGDETKQGQPWVDKTGKGENAINQNVVKYLNQMIEAAESKIPRQSLSTAGGVLKVDRQFVSIFSSGSSGFIDIASNTLRTILGEPTSDEKVEHGGELENRVVRFSGGISVVYMLSRGDGVSLSIPRASIPMLKENMRAHGLLEASGHAQGA